MSLPLSPPPSRSASQASFHKYENTATTYTANSTTTSISSSPLTPSSMTSPVSPGARQSRPPIPTLPSPQASTFLTSPTPVSTALQSFFSPCSSDEEDDDDDDSDDDEEIGTPSAQEKPKGHFQRLWASRDPPSTPPSCPPPPVPRRPSALGSPTFGWKQQKTDDGSEVPNSWHTPPSIRESIRSAPAVLPAESRLSPAWQSSTPPSPTIAAGGAVEGPPTDPFLSSLHSILTSQLQSLTPLLTSPPPELAAARLTRDKLLVKTQKAYFRRASVSALQTELQAAEERVRQIEHSVVTQFLGVLEGIVEGVKDGCETAMAAENAAYQEWEQGRRGLEGGLECPPLEIITEARPKLVVQASSEETIVHFTRPPLPPAPPPPPPLVESPLSSPQLSKLSPSPHPISSPTFSTTTSISSSTTTSPSSSPISRGRGRLRGGTFGYEACTCENISDHDCANEAWPWDPLVVKVGDVEMRMI